MKAQEIWKDIPNYEGLYQASNLGRIKSLERYKLNGKNSVMRIPTRILKPILAKNNSNPRRKDVRVSLYKNSKMKYCLVGRLVASAFYGNSDLTVNHINGNTLDNRIENLEWCSNSENIKKGFKKGLYDGMFTKIIVFDKKTNVTRKFKSCASAGRYYKLKPEYWFNKKKENQRFKWEML